MRLPNIKIRQSQNQGIKNNLCNYECNSSIVEKCPSKFDDDIQEGMTDYDTHYRNNINDTDIHMQFIC